MEPMDDINRRLRVSRLEAKRELIEIERDALLNEINSSLTSQDRREEAFARREELMSQWNGIMEELEILRRPEPQGKIANEGAEN
jgi:hypothetical protein